MKHSAQAIEAIVQAAESLRKRAKTEKDPILAAGALAIMGIAIALHGGHANIEELRTITLRAAMWTVRHE